MAAKSLTGLEKAAVLLKSLPTSVVDKIMRHMGAKHAVIIETELEKLKKDSQLGAKMSDVLDEVTKILESAKKKPEVTGPAPTPPSESAAKTSQVDIRLDGTAEDKPAPLSLAPDAQTDPLRALASVPPEVLAKALDSETARTISLLINGLDIAAAGEVYKRLSPAKRKEVSLRFTEQPKANEELIKRIAQAVLRKCQALRESPAQSGEGSDRDKRVAALLRGLERTERTEMLTMLEQSDAELVARVKTMLYQFEDIQLMENTSVQKLLAEVDMKSLVLALSGTTPEIESKILGNLSKRAQAALREEAELVGKIASAKAKQGRQTLVEAIQRLDERGDLVLIES